MKFRGKKVLSVLISILMVLLLFSTVGALSTTANERRFGRVDTEGSNLRVRSGPGTGYVTVGILSDFTYFEIAEEVDGWYKIITPSITGFNSSATHCPTAVLKSPYPLPANSVAISSRLLPVIAA